MFFTKYNRKSDCVTPVGSTVLKTPIIDEHGVVTDYDVTDLDEFIQSNRDNGNVALILEKYAVTGDDSYLNVTNGFYGDITDSQDMTIHDRHYQSAAAVEFYESMPDSIKELYPTPDEFFANVNDSKVAAIFNSSTVDDIADVVEGGEEVE